MRSEKTKHWYYLYVIIILMSFFLERVGAFVSSLCFSVQTCSTPLRPPGKWPSNCLWEWREHLRRIHELQKAGTVAESTLV